MNIFAIITITVMFLMTSYSIYLTQSKKQKLTSMSGMVISMTIAMMTGLLSGFLAGVYTGDMFLSSGISIIIGFTTGFLAGQPIGILSVLNGASAGLIAGLIGAILGVMLQFTTPTIMLGILLLLYAIILGLVITYIFVAASDKLSLDTKGISPFAILSAGVVLIISFLFLYSSDLVKVPGAAAAQTQTSSGQTANAGDIDVSHQSVLAVKIQVTSNGYTPNVIQVKKGIPVQLEITNPLEDSCLSTLNIPDFNINNANLIKGTTHIKFTPNKTGQFTFSCGMNMFKGTIIVK